MIPASVLELREEITIKDDAVRSVFHGCLNLSKGSPLSATLRDSIILNTDIMSIELDNIGGEKCVLI